MAAWAFTCAHNLVCPHGYILLFPALFLLLFWIKPVSRGSLCPTGLALPSGHPARLRAMALHLPWCRPGPSVLMLSATSENFSCSPFLTGLPSQAVAEAYLCRANPAHAAWAGVSSSTHSCPHQGFTDGAFIRQEHGTQSQRSG